MSCLPVRPNAVRCQPWSAEIHLRFPVSCDHVLTHKFSLPFHIVIGHKLVVTSFADGSGGPFSRPARLRRARSPVRTSPLASELLPTAKHFHSRAALAGLTCRATPANSSPFAALTTPERLRSLRSASSLSFLVTCQRQVIPSHSFAALAALVVRRVKGDVALLICRVNGIAALFVRRVSSSADRPMRCLCLPPARPPEGHWRAHPAAAPCRRQAENR